jgi:ABC-2 type transport system ATP-binding protein
VTPERVQAVKQALEHFSSISTIETVGAADGHVQLRVLPKDGSWIANDVTRTIHEKAVAIDEIYIERGKLDDVFRLITTSETGAGHA